VFYVPPQEKEIKKGWFWSSAPKNEEEPQHDILLGKFNLETKHFLTRRCLAGDFPLQNIGGRDAGGVLGLCIRTGISFSFSPDDLSSDAIDYMTPYAAMSFASIKADVGN